MGPLSRRNVTWTTIAVLAFAMSIVPPPRASAQSIAWTRQFGTASNDDAFGVAVDASGNAYVAGFTGDALPGQTFAGITDAYVRKYDSSGSVVWTRQFGTASGDEAFDVAVDASGNVYVVGSAGGALPGQTSGGLTDAFVRKFDSNGSVLWTDQFGTAGIDRAHGVAVDASGNPYVAGRTEGTLPGETSAGGADAFVRKYDSVGSVIWTRQFGSAGNDEARGVAADPGGEFLVTGVTDGALPGQISAGGIDAFVRKYDSNGSVVWTRQFGTTATDEALRVAADPGGSVYVPGVTGGVLPGQTSAGGDDAFLRKYDASGSELWTRQFGTSAFDGATGVSVDASGNAHVSGVTAGVLPGQTSAGSFDAFARKYDPSGGVLWTHQFGTASSDLARVVAMDTAGNAYTAGFTLGTFPGETSAGASDAFLTKIAPAPTLTVNTTDDLNDGACTVGHCSLREAIIAANANAGSDTIVFNITPSGAKTISPTSALPSITGPVTIDGTTQPGFAGSPIIELNGSGAPSVGGIFVNGLTISGGGTIVRGLVINRFAGAGIFLIGGSGNVIEGNYIGTNMAGTADLGNLNDGIIVLDSSNNTVGGSTASKRNVISGNDDDGVSMIGASTGNVIDGNYVGTNAAGSAALGNTFVGIFGGGSGSGVAGNTIRGNVISANGQDGIRLNDAATTANVIQGNLIGTDASGTMDLGNGQQGIFLEDGTSANTIGGAGSGQANTISGNGFDGILLSGAGSGNGIQGNRIGTRADGSAALGNSLNGIRILASGTTVGGAAGAANRIAHNGQSGILVNSGTGNVLSRNEIFSNSGLGIDLAPGGVTANDPGDVDVGANDLQNFPVLTSVITSAGGTTIQGTLASAANATYTIEVFASAACDPSGNGEGQTFRGSTTVATNSTGDATFTITATTPISATERVTATATGSAGTSEFSACLAPVVLPGRIAFVDGLGVGLVYPDGSGLVSLSCSVSCHQPNWSPNGAKIAFVTRRDGNKEIYVMNADGSSQTRLTTHAGLDDTPAWSPDGAKIAFTRQDPTTFQLQVYVMNADGTGLTNISGGSFDDFDPAWSPDGTKIAFVSGRDGNGEIYVMNANGSGQTRLTNDAEADGSPAWSPDGTKIAFSSSRDQGFPSFDIYVMKADGTGQTRLTTDSAVDEHPAWSPDGSKVAFWSDRLSGQRLFLMNPDGTGQSLISTVSSPAAEPHWGSLSTGETTSGAVAAGGSVTTDTENDGATSSDAIETKVTSPNAGTVTITESTATGTAPSGYTLLGVQVNITAPAASASDPLVITFTIDASLVPPGGASAIQPRRNGVLVPTCAGAPPAASPDPCYTTTTLAGGDVQLTIRSSQASEWTFIVPSDDDGKDKKDKKPKKPKKDKD